MPDILNCRREILNCSAIQGASAETVFWLYDFETYVVKLALAKSGSHEKLAESRLDNRNTFFCWGS